MYGSLPVEVTDGQVSLLAADDHILPRNTHISHLLLQRLAAEVLPIHRVKVEGVFILGRENKTPAVSNIFKSCLDNCYPLISKRCVHLERCFALQAGVDQQVTLPGDGQVEDGERQRAFARRSQATHVLTPTHRVDDHRPVLGRTEWKHTLNNTVVPNLLH